MKKFILLYKNPHSAMSAMDPASIKPEAIKATMDAWMAWYGKAGSAITDGGAPLESVTQLGHGKAGAGHNPVTGYTIVQAENFEALKPLLDGHPHLLTPESNIEVLELKPMGPG